ncbi:hypothetical protein VSX64_19900 [Aurantimonas sp. C2-6-R+9]|uniref:hypothetical protein n=1 Tax=unclassified Aurantimonas TaxID=2638230 RepID=UPI002E19E316|nr:hypothetical protein [Aurantimonas sp. C2-6-R+9]
MTELLATTDISAEEFGAAPRARAGETFTATPEEAARLMEAGLVVHAGGAEAALHRDARAALIGPRRK